MIGPILALALGLGSPVKVLELEPAQVHKMCSAAKPAPLGMMYRGCTLIDPKSRKPCRIIIPKETSTSPEQYAEIKQHELCHCKTGPQHDAKFFFCVKGPQLNVE